MAPSFTRYTSTFSNRSDKKCAKSIIMATTFKTFLNDDVVSTKSLLNEYIPITGSIVTGTYSDNNIKNYSHGMFQSVYDYPYLNLLYT